MKEIAFTQKWNAALTYAEYKDLSESLVRKGETSGPGQVETRVSYTKLNDQRMKRLDKTTRLDPGLVSTLRNISGNYGWLVLAETWCGDVANTIPLMNKMAEQTPNIQLRFLMRDEHPDLMHEFLTEGTESIPKLIVINLDTFAVIGTWGPRPNAAQQIMERDRNNPAVSFAHTLEKIQRWYLEDRGATMQLEFQRLIPLWEEAVFGVQQMA